MATYFYFNIFSTYEIQGKAELFFLNECQITQYSLTTMKFQHQYLG